jgi:hypothetical protein
MGTVLNQLGCAVIVSTFNQPLLLDVACSPWTARAPHTKSSSPTTARVTNPRRHRAS